MTDPRDGFTAEERAVLDAYRVSGPSVDWVDRVMSAVDGEAQPSQPSLPPLPAPRRRGGRWGRPVVRAALILSGTAMVTAAAAEQGVFGPVAQRQVQAVVAAALAPVTRTRPAAPRAAVPIAVDSAAPLAAATPPVLPPATAPERIAPVLSRLQANPQTAPRVARYLERRAQRQEARGEAPTPPDLAELIRDYRQLPPARQKRLREQLRRLPPEDQAEIRALIRQYRAERRASARSAPGPAEAPSAAAEEPATAEPASR
ncbi:hypothetical protein ACFOON_11820 [Novosphingobium piscinae]|uniref:Uncharacterized protein n=1 Tax=Novosphingobium piscinae TaxID=1507448 RepID=A0A7X1KNW2_9SPHN|nr:hypothetical protein [Novosphingobium piscinae]MBC2668096.1 hypothetical protein [Novosphingobium piscinae]